MVSEKDTVGDVLAAHIARTGLRDIPETAIREP